MVEVGVQVSGTIAELLADFNSTVKAGQVVARLDPSVYESQLEAARGQLAQATAEASQMQTALDDAKRKLTRAEELAAQELITQAELDDARIVDAAGRGRPARAGRPRFRAPRPGSNRRKSISIAPSCARRSTASWSTGPSTSGRRCRDAPVAGALHHCRRAHDEPADRSQRRRSRRGQPRLGRLVPGRVAGPARRSMARSRTFGSSPMPSRPEPWQPRELPERPA